MKQIILVVGMVGLGLGLIFAFSDVIVEAIEGNIDRVEIVQCQKLQQQAIDYPLFWATESEVEMCMHHKIDLSEWLLR